MDLQRVKKGQRFENWSEMVFSCRNSGQTVAEWCESQGINLKTYYYRQKQVFANLGTPIKPERVEFAALTSLAPPESRISSGISIEIGQAVVRVETGADTETLRQVLQTLRSLC
ncbi:hypothetical protein HCH52_12125 [Oscillospiraceae bacterium HV4-5-C5C]|nr:hypothetical protein [Oscillospiraceae bacterium HV4-5-C5C]